MSAIAYPPRGPCIVRGEGSFLEADDGRRYLDAASGTFNVILGYGRSEVSEAVRAVLDSGLAHVSSAFSNPIVEQAARMLVELSPSGLSACHMKGATGGSTAVEQAMRACHALNGGDVVATFARAHHGQTSFAGALSGLGSEARRTPGVSLNVLRLEAPDCYRCPFALQPDTCSAECLDASRKAVLEKVEHGHRIAAFVAEPILGAGGGLAPPRHFWLALQEFMSSLGIPIILDEVQTFARTGHFFAAEYYGLRPSHVALAKGISGIGLPGAGAVLHSDEFRTLNKYERSLTGGASPICCAAIVATLKIMSQPAFFPEMKVVATRLEQGLSEFAGRFEQVGVVRGVGLMLGIEMVRPGPKKLPDPQLARRVRDEASRLGLLVRLSEYDEGAFVKVRPPLTISSPEVEQLLSMLGSAIEHSVRDSESGGGRAC